VAADLLWKKKAEGSELMIPTRKPGFTCSDEVRKRQNGNGDSKKRGREKKTGENRPGHVTGHGKITPVKTGTKKRRGIKEKGSGAKPPQEKKKEDRLQSWGVERTIKRGSKVSKNGPEKGGKRNCRDGKRRTRITELRRKNPRHAQK